MVERGTPQTYCRLCSLGWPGIFLMTDFIISWLIIVTQSFRIVDKEKFQVLFKYQWPTTKEFGIPIVLSFEMRLFWRQMRKLSGWRSTSKQVVIILFLILLTYWLQTILGKMPITFDAWTSKSYDSYLAITAHYIDSAKGDTYEWQLKSKVLGFEELHGRHTGKNMATTISNILDTYDIKDNVDYTTFNAIAKIVSICSSDGLPLIMQPPMIRPSLHLPRRWMMRPLVIIVLGILSYSFLFLYANVN